MGPESHQANLSHLLSMQCPFLFLGAQYLKLSWAFWVRNTCTAVRAPEKKGTLLHLLLYKVQWLLCAHFNKAGSSSSSYGTMWNWKWDSEKVSQISNPYGQHMSRAHGNRLPYTHCMEYFVFPAWQKPSTIFTNAIISVEISHHTPDFVSCLLHYWQLPESCSCDSWMPLLIRFSSFHSLQTFTRHYVENLATKHLFLYGNPFRNLVWHWCVKCFKQSW